MGRSGVLRRYVGNCLPRTPPPDIGYKYRGFNDEFGLSILRDREIFYAPPYALNDPLDCRIDVPAHFLKALESFPENTLNGKALRAIAKATVTRSVGGAKISLLESFNETLNEGGVFCLCGTATEPLMWAHYGQGHRGFCIGFARWFIEWLRNQLSQHKVAGFGPVNYVSVPDLTQAFIEHLPRLRQFGTQAEQFDWIRDYAQSVIAEVLSTKAKAWRYEREYRSMRTAPGKVPFSPKAIAEIVFGAHSRKSDEDSVRQILAGAEWNHVRYRRATFSRLTFELALIDA